MKAKKFLAMLLSLTMIFALTVPALADTANKAKIGDNEYPTLAAAVSAAQAGDTIKLIGDETITSTLTIGKDLTLDLNGRTLTMTVTSGMTGAVYVNSHSLTIQDSSDGQAGRIDITSNSGNGAYGFYLSGSGSSLSVESGSITATNYYNSNGSYFSQKGINAVYVSSGTSFTMSGGSLTASNANNSGKAAYAVYVSGGTANITGGSIIVDDHDTDGWSDDHLVYKSSGTVNITGGKFKSPKQLDFNGITSKLTGGYMLAAADDDGYRAVISAVAQIGSAKYTTLAEAFAAVQEGQTITLLANTETGETYTHSNPLVLDTDNVTLDLGGNTLTITSNMSLVVRSDNGVVTNGTIVPGITDTKVTNWCRYGLTIDDCDGVTISDIVSQTGIAIGGDPDDNYTPGAAPATNVTISDCTVTGRTSRYAVFAQNFSTATITGGTYNAASANAGVLYAAFSATDGNPGVINVTGGKFFGTITQKNAGSIIIKGGEYSKTPAAFVADGYEVTDNADATYPFAVEKVKVYVAQIGDQKYEKLSDAILALEDNDTLTLLTDYDFVANEGHEYYWIDDGGNQPYNKNNQLEIAANNVTIDLNEHAITNLMNNSICIGSNAAGVTYQNITIKNGSLEVGIDDYARKDNKLYAYVVSVRHSEGVKFENLTTLGGINVANGSVVEIDGLTFEGTKFYAVCAQDGSEVTLKDGDFSKYEKGSANTLFWVQAGSSMNIYGGTYNLTGTTKFENDTDPVLYGGTYNFDPTAYVATGYEAVNNGDGTYTVRSATPTATVGMSITLEDNIVVNFFVSELSHSPARYTVNYRFEGGTATEANLGEVVEYESGIYRFAVATATAKQMTDKVYFDVYADDTLIKTVTYSIAQYCDTQTSTSADTELVELCKATSTFGAKAQAYFNYKTGNAPVDYSEEFDASEIPSASEYAAEKSAAVTYPVSASLNLLSKTELNFYIYNTASYYEIYGVEEKLSDSDSWNNITVSQERNNDGKMKVTIPGVSPDRLDNTYRLHIASDEYVTYSPLTYVTRHANDGDALGALCQSLYFYYKTARDYTAN